MCGFTGFWDFKAEHSREELLHLAETMALEIKERGPDSSGTWCDEKVGLSFGYRRLAIIDLSPAGDQPMVSQSKNLVFIYNGEIFNAPELRDELKKAGYEFRGHSDTEVILAGCEAWGVEATCKRLIGMFAFALWDRRVEKLFLVRDRLGIKPLYWGFNNGILFFGSQPKTFFKHPKFKSEICREALTSYFRYNYVPTPQSIFKGIQKSIPGTITVIDRAGASQEIRFWDLREIICENKKIENKLNYKNINSEITKDMTNELDTLLRDAVKRRMVADVPLGAFLSGGIDSTTVVALMQSQSNHPIKTFSIGFFEEEYNEAQHAAVVAKHLGTDHHELYLTSKECQNIIPDIPNWYDEPFADSSQIPTYLVSRLAREKVTVSLSGDGGDELFAGYNRYLVGKGLWRWIENMPSWMRSAGSYGIKSLRPGYWDQLARVIPTKLRPRLLADKAYKLAEILSLPSNQAFYRSIISYWEKPEELVLGGNEKTLYPWDKRDLPGDLHFIENMQFMDTLTYLPDDILTKVDRASMAVSLEARVPLLDHRVVEYVWGLPLDVKIREGKTKWLLRQVLGRYIPLNIIERPKMGFGVPIESLAARAVERMGS